MNAKLLVGTTKGAFIVLNVNGQWRINGPFCSGTCINHFIRDPQTGTLFAAGGGDFLGAVIWKSEDHGENWTLVRLTNGSIDKWKDSEPEFVAAMGITEDDPPFGKEFSQVWSLATSGGLIYAGTKPARLLVSDDLGATWSKVEGLTNHPSFGDWAGGAAGLILHTIVTAPQSPQKLWVGISAAGVFASQDGGNTWERRNTISDQSLVFPEIDHPAAPKDGQTGLCIHNMVRASGDGDILYQQNHHGVWKSENGGQSWEDITQGLPSIFGFPIAVHPRDPRTVWSLPLLDDMGRFPIDGAVKVWKSTDAGSTWHAKTTGLPQQDCFFTVLRQAMSVYMETNAHVFFGTNSGTIFGSFDEGETWTTVAQHLPTILSVEAI